MGINDLWMAVALAGDKHSLLEYATSWTIAQKHDPSITEGSRTNRLQLGVDANEVIIIFNGPAKPAIKRGKHVMKTPPWLIEPFKHFVEMLGFAVHDAAGEAEAELAALGCSGIIDAVITEDRDALHYSNPGCSNNIIIYSADNIQRHGQVMLSNGGLLLMALLCGGDYHFILTYLASRMDFQAVGGKLHVD
ncbi:hypothetical protein BDR06DRAFT_1006659 [Suillus hirtellus]|nr:hypothetical protein BDR06DRAFT_1006659 [Suillus hirtellus]